MARLESLKGALRGRAVAPADPTPAKASAPESRIRRLKRSLRLSPLRPRAPLEKPVVGDALLALRDNWRELVDRVGHVAGLAKSYRIDAKPVKVGSQVSIGFDPEFAANKDKSTSRGTDRPSKRSSARC